MNVFPVCNHRAPADRARVFCGALSAGVFMYMESSGNNAPLKNWRNGLDVHTSLYYKLVCRRSIMSVPETLAAGKAKPTPWTANQAVNIPYSDTALNSLIGGVLALASWTVWAYWSRPQHAGARGVILVLIPFVWIAAKIWLSRRCVPDDSATNAKRRRRWKLGLAILVSLVCVVCWYAWSSIWLSTVPQLSTAPRMWQMLVYLSQLMH